MKECSDSTISYKQSKYDFEILENSLCSFITNNKFYLDLIDGLLEGVIIHRDNRIVFANKSLLKMFSIGGLDNIINKNIIDFFQAHLMSFEDRFIEEYHNDDTTITYKVKLMDENSYTKIKMKSNYVSLENVEYSITYIQEFPSDRENSCININELRNSKEFKNKYEEYISNLIPVLAHELRTPLNILMCSLQILDLHLKDEKSILNNYTKIQYNSQVMRQNSYRLLKLINNVIDSSEIEARGVKLNLGLYDMVEVVEDTVLTVRNFVNENIKGKDIDINFFTNLDEKNVYLDMDKFQNILLKILSNSVKFSESGHGICVSMREDNLRGLEIAIYNDSEVVYGENIDNIFNKFSFNKDKLAKSHEGIGLGLFIVRNLVELHGWSISAFNFYNSVGSKFIIRIPNDKIINEEGTLNKKIYDVMEEELIGKIRVEFSDIQIGYQ